MTLLAANSWAGEKESKLDEDTRRILERSALNAKLWDLEKGVEFKEITEEILASSIVSEARKQLFMAQGRRFFLFTYPSLGVKVKATVSFVPHAGPTLVNLRGGNRQFGLPSPSGDISCMENFTVLTPAYRGGVGEGEDEFGGADVHDVKALIDFIPELEDRLAISIPSENMFLQAAAVAGCRCSLRSPAILNFRSAFPRGPPFQAFSKSIRLWPTGLI